jgi:ATP-dependent Lon protease
MLTRSKRKNNLLETSNEVIPTETSNEVIPAPAPRRSSRKRNALASKYNSDSDPDYSSESELDSTESELEEYEPSEPAKKKQKFVDDSDDSSDADGAIGDLWEAIINKARGEETSDDSQQNADDSRWKADLTAEEANAHEVEFNAISYQISLMPTIGSILKLNIPFKEKCEMVEKIRILENLTPNTMDYFAAKMELLESIKQRETQNFTKELCEKYELAEKSLEYADSRESLPIKYQILDADMPHRNKAVLFRKYNQLSALSTANSEHPKLNEWVKWALSIPFGPRMAKSAESATVMKYLSDVKAQLDSDVYGLDQVKEQLLFVLNRKLTSPSAIGSGMAIVGPPGTAKTSLIQSLAKAIKIPVAQISLGGAKDGSFLDGHGYTYEGSTPGAIVYALRQLKCNDGIIFFDEFDKVSNTAYGAEISRLLLHITDFTQNHSFHDKYLSNEFPIDLSKIWFIYSLNDVDMLDRTLRDRVPIIRVHGYSKPDKKQIALEHLIPKALSSNNLSCSEIIFADAAVDFLIQKSEESAIKDSSGKSGVRQLKHNIETIAMKLSLLKTASQDLSVDLKLTFKIKNFALPFDLTQSVAESLLAKSGGSPVHLSMYL